MPTLSKLLPAYKEYLEHERGLARQTIKAYGNDVEYLQAVIGDKDVVDITLDDLRGHVRKMSKSGLAVATIRRRIHSLNTFYKYLILCGHVTEAISNRIHLPKRQRKQPVWLSDGEMKRFAETPSEYAIAWTLLAWFGLRRSEVINLDWRDVRMGDEILIVRDTKSKDDRVMPIPAAVRPALWDAWHAAGTPVGGRVVPIGKSAFARRFKKHLIACGLTDKGITPHTLRHSFASGLIRQGVSLAAVKDLLGHKDVSTTMIYIHHSDKILQDAMDKHILGN